MHYIYCITDTTNGKRYVGQAKSPKKRWNQHKSDARVGRKQCPKLHSAMRKRCPDGCFDTIFRLEVVNQFPTQDEADRAERFYIAALDTIDSGYNLAEGGQVQAYWTGKKRGPLPQAHREAISRALKVVKKGTRPTKEAIELSKVANAKLTEEQIKQVLFYVANSELSYRDVACLYGVSPAAIGKIARGESWAHLQST